MAYTTKKGHRLLNPSEKARKYVVEIKHKKAITNDWKRKRDENGNQKKLTKQQLAYRAGYLDHQKDCNKAFRAKNPNYKRKTTR